MTSTEIAAHSAPPSIGTPPASGFRFTTMPIFIKSSAYTGIANRMLSSMLDMLGAPRGKVIADIFSVSKKEDKGVFKPCNASQIELMSSFAALIAKNQLSHDLCKLIKKIKYISPTMVVNLLRPLMLAGHRQQVMKLVADIDVDQIQEARSMVEMASTLIYLGEYEKAEIIFTAAEKYCGSWGEFYLYKTNLYFCRRDYERLVVAMEKAASIHGVTPSVEFRKSLCALYCGRFMESIRYSRNVIECASGSGNHLSCASHVLSGLARRAMCQMEASERILRLASEHERPIPWVWIARFEYAISLLYAGKDRQALSIAQDGAEARCSKHGSHYNPCRFLVMLLRGDTLYSTEIYHDLIRRAHAWPYPTLPVYEIWMLFMAMAIFNKNNMLDLMGAAFEILICNPAMPREISDEIAAMRVKDENLFAIPEFVTIIAQAIAPYAPMHKLECCVLNKLIAREK